MKILTFAWISMVLLFSDIFRINVMHGHGLGECVPDQKAVLLQIQTQLSYNSSLSFKLVLWDERVDCCQWPGVSCNHAGYIIGVDLSYEPITGGTNAFFLLKLLSSLSVIRLDWLNFSAPFPDLFTDFSNLTVLSLKNCNFSGTVPQKVFQVPTLQIIDLSFNKMLEGSLPDFPENGSLQSLQLGITKFSGRLPESIGNLRLLSHIDLTGCSLSGAIPASITKLTNLVELRLGGNHFSGWIPPFKLFKNLTEIGLSNNDFTGEIPSSHWDGLNNLESLYLDGNSFSGPIPPSLFFLPSLTTLSLFKNKFSGHINELQNVTSQLIDLDLSGNYLEGTVPLLAVETNIRAAELSLLPEFRILYLASCNLHKFPDFLKNQSKLQMLDLSSNAISGEIPEWISEMGTRNLLFLNLSHNLLDNMQEPKEYGSLYFLDLNSNMFSGHIPRPPRVAVYLDLSNNSFSSLPLDIGHQLPNVSFFSVANNRVSGTIPLSCGNLPADLFLELKAILVDRNAANSKVGYLHFKSQEDADIYYQDSVSLSLKGQEPEEKESAYHGDIYASVALGFVVGLGGIFLPLLLSNKWRLYYNKKIDGVVLKVFFRRDKGRRKNSR
nr:receptor-like protein 12 [Ipomoea batatas]